MQNCLYAANGSLMCGAAVENPVFEDFIDRKGRDVFVQYFIRKKKEEEEAKKKKEEEEAKARQNGISSQRISAKSTSQPSQQQPEQKKGPVNLAARYNTR